jgi:lantibiotic modifying enzyme
MYSIESDEFTRKSRLGWCYGDLGIAQALLQAAKALCSEFHENMALKVLLHACNRKDLKENLVVDGGICHGTSGISHIFNRLYINSKVDDFKEISGHWMKKTIEMAQYSDGLAGFKSWQGEKYGWKNQYSLLEGIIGIGLSILSQLNPNLTNWDECLLLS